MPTLSSQAALEVVDHLQCCLWWQSWYHINSWVSCYHKIYGLYFIRVWFIDISVNVLKTEHCCSYGDLTWNLEIWHWFHGSLKMFFYKYRKYIVEKMQWPFYLLDSHYWLDGIFILKCRLWNGCFNIKMPAYNIGIPILMMHSLTTGNHLITIMESLYLAGRSLYWKNTLDFFSLLAMKPGVCCTSLQAGWSRLFHWPNNNEAVTAKRVAIFMQQYRSQRFAFVPLDGKQITSCILPQGVLGSAKLWLRFEVNASIQLNVWRVYIVDV